VNESGRSPSPRLRFAVLFRDGFICWYCGARPPDVRLVIDHFEPWANGGRTEYRNLVTACEECNYGKSDTVIWGRFFYRYINKREEEHNYLLLKSMKAIADKFTDEQIRGWAHALPSPFDPEDAERWREQVQVEIIEGRTPEEEP